MERITDYRAEFWKLPEKRQMGSRREVGESRVGGTVGRPWASEGVISCLRSGGAGVEEEPGGAPSRKRSWGSDLWWRRQTQAEDPSLRTSTPPQPSPRQAAASLLARAPGPLPAFSPAATRLGLRPPGVGHWPGAALQPAFFQSLPKWDLPHQTEQHSEPRNDLPRSKEELVESFTFHPSPELL